MTFKDYECYRWFFTSSGKLVIGGKNAEQNEEIVERALPNDVLLHTSCPGSPFCLVQEPSKRDLREIAVFTACFSQAWKSEEKISVDVFLKKEMKKPKKVKQGTFLVREILQSISVKNPKLYLKFQKEKIRATPFTPGLVIIKQGNLTKEDAGKKIKAIIESKTKKEININEVYSAIPSNNMEIE